MSGAEQVSGSGGFFIFATGKMEALEKIILLGDPRLYQKCEPVRRNELGEALKHAQEMGEAVRAFRKRYGKGRAIAAPQTGYMKRMIWDFPDNPQVMINPELKELWDDCMSFPNLLVRVRRHKGCKVVFRDPEWNVCEMVLEDDLSELVQHEYDHLNGILAIQRAHGLHPFRWVNF